MKRAFLAFAAASVVALLASCAAPPAGAPKTAEAPAPAAATATIQGAWDEVRNEGQPVTGKTWTFTGDKVVIHHNGVVYSGTFSTADSGESKEINFTFDGYPTNEGLYLLAGDRFTFKVRESAAGRATNLDREKGYTLIECQRATGKPAQDAPDAAEQPAAATPAK